MAVVLVLVTASCGLFGSESSPARTDSTGDAEPSLATIRLLDAGVVPRRQLRLALTEGTTTTLDLFVDVDVEQGSGPTKIAVDTPSIKEVIELTVGPVDTTGAEVRFEFVDAAIDAAGTALAPSEILQLTADVKAIVGVGGSGRINLDGSFESFSYEGLQYLDPRLAGTLRDTEAQLAGMVAPLPDRPVGVGARWEATTRSTSAGITVDQVTTYELKSIDGTVVSYQAHVVQTAGPQALAATSLGDTTSARIVSSRLTGITTGSFDLTSLAGTASSTLTGEQKVAVDAGPKPETLSQTVTITVAISPR